MSGRGQGEPIRDEAIVAALAAGLSQEQAALRAGTSARTVRRRLQNPAFRDWLEEAKQDPQELQRVYTALEHARAAWTIVESLEESDYFDVTTREVKIHAERLVAWLDELAWTLEEECAG